MLLNLGFTLLAGVAATWTAWKLQSWKKTYFPELCGCCPRRLRSGADWPARVDGGALDTIAEEPPQTTKDPLWPSARIVVPWEVNDSFVYAFLADKVQSFDKAVKLASDRENFKMAERGQKDFVFQVKSSQGRSSSDSQGCWCTVRVSANSLNTVLLNSSPLKEMCRCTCPGDIACRADPTQPKVCYHAGGVLLFLCKVERPDLGDLNQALAERAAGSSERSRTSADDWRGRPSLSVQASVMNRARELNKKLGADLRAADNWRGGPPSSVQASRPPSSRSGAEVDAALREQGIVIRAVPQEQGARKRTRLGEPIPPSSDTYVPLSSLFKRTRSPAHRVLRSS